MAREVLFNMKIRIDRRPVAGCSSLSLPIARSIRWDFQEPLSDKMKANLHAILDEQLLAIDAYLPTPKTTDPAPSHPEEPTTEPPGIAPEGTP